MSSHTVRSMLKERHGSLGQLSGGAALLDAITEGKIHLAKFILEAVDSYPVANTRDVQGRSPLIKACYIKEAKARSKAVELLVRCGADVNLQDDCGRTALSYACELGCNDVVRLLIKNNVDPEIPDYKGSTALMHCAMVGNDVGVGILTKSFRRLGLDVDKTNDEGMAAIHLAAKNGFVECASLLAQEGRASVTKRDRHRGLNAEQLAREAGCSTPEVVPFSVAPSRHRRTRHFCPEGAALSGSLTAQQRFVFPDITDTEHRFFVKRSQSINTAISRLTGTNSSRSSSVLDQGAAAALSSIQDTAREGSRPGSSTTVTPRPDSGANSCRGSRLSRPRRQSSVPEFGAKVDCGDVQHSFGDETTEDESEDEEDMMCDVTIDTTDDEDGADVYGDVLGGAAFLPDINGTRHRVSSIAVEDLEVTADHDAQTTGRHHHTGHRRATAADECQSRKISTSTTTSFVCMNPGKVNGHV